METHPLSTTSYTCPMHPQVQQNKAGKCPTCGMELVPQQQEGSGTRSEHGGRMRDQGEVMASEKNHVPDVALNNRRARWGRRGVIASLLIGMGGLAVKSFSWFHFSAADGGDYQVIAQWQVPTGGKGFIIAISPGSTREELRALGNRVQERFHGVDNVAVMIFDDANAAREVRRGSRIVSETEFQAALVHQRAMYLKSSARDEDSFTIYDSYPNIREVIRFGNEVLPEPAK